MGINRDIRNQWVGTIRNTRNHEVGTNKDMIKDMYLYNSLLPEGNPIYYINRCIHLVESTYEFCTITYESSVHLMNHHFLVRLMWHIQ